MTNVELGMEHMRISRRSFLKAATAVTLSSGLTHCSTPKRKPNIILIMADDLGYGDLGCYGSDWINTPNIDKLAANGIRFTDYHSNGAVCTPTRAALLTGRYQQRSLLEGVIYVGKPTRLEGLDTSEYTFAEAFKSAGYKTACIGKWHLGYEKLYNPVHHGFDEFRGYVSGNIDYISHFDNHGIFDWWHNLELVEGDGYCTDLITNHAVHFIKDHKDEPFCLYVAHEAPHWPYQGRTSTADRYPGSTPPEVPGRGLDPNPKERFKEMIEVMDEGVGEIIETVEKLNLQSDTFIFFCSDNGGDPPWGSNGVLRGNKGQLWEGGHRVPAIAYWPGKISAGESDQLVLSMDLFPTMCAVAGVSQKTPKPLDGIDFSPLLFQGTALNERDVFWRYRKQKAVRRGSWKFLIEEDNEYLFDLKNDVAETTNLLESFSQKADELRQALFGWEQDVPRVESQKTK